MQKILLNGEEFQFPDNMTDEEIQKVLTDVLTNQNKPSPSGQEVRPSPIELSRQSEGYRTGVRFDIPQNTQVLQENVDLTFPRTSKSVERGDSSPKQVLNAGLDLLTLPGRTLASLSELASGNFNESMKDTKGERFLGKVLRSPSTAAMTVAAPFTAGASLLGLAQMGAAGALGTQLENVSESEAPDLYKSSEEASLPEFAGETGLNIVGGKVGQLAGQYVVKPALSTLGKIGKSAWENSLLKYINPTENQTIAGVKKSVLSKYGLGGRPDKALEQINKTIQSNAEDMNTVLGIGRESFDIRPVTDKTLDSFLKENPGFNKELTRLSQKLKIKSDEFTGATLKPVNDFRRVVADYAEFYRNSNSPEKEAAVKFLDRLNGELKESIQRNMVPESAEIFSKTNETISDLLPIQSALEKRLTGDKPFGFWNSTKELFGKATSPFNLGAEALLHTVAPGAPTALRVTGPLLEGVAQTTKGLSSPEYTATTLRELAELSKTKVPSSTARQLADLFETDGVPAKNKSLNEYAEEFANKINEVDQKTGVNESLRPGLKRTVNRMSEMVAELEGNLARVRDPSTSDLDIRRIADGLGLPNAFNEDVLVPQLRQEIERLLTLNLRVSKLAKIPQEALDYATMNEKYNRIFSGIATPFTPDSVPDTLSGIFGGGR